MGEVEVGGIKFKGGKAVAVVMALSTVGGGLWAGFEFWKDYQDLQETVLSYTAPDLSGFDRRLAVQSETVEAVHKEMASVRLRVAEIQQLARDLREDVRSETAKVYDGIGAVDSRSRSADGDTRAAMRQAEKTVRQQDQRRRCQARCSGGPSKQDATARPGQPVTKRPVR